MLVEMVLLGFIARKLYKRMLPNQDGDSVTHISTIGSIMASDSHNNNNIINCSNNNKTSDKLGNAQVGYTNPGLDVNEK